MIVIVPCSSRKLDRRAPAADLYVGSYFEAMLAAARALVDEDSIRILSGRHGFVRLDDKLDPYEQRIDEPGAITVDELRCQIEDDFELLVEPEIVVLAGKSYSDAVEAALGRPVRLPFARARGIGDHLSIARRIRLRSVVDQDR